MQISKGFLVAIFAQLLLFAGVHSLPPRTSKDNQAISEGVTVEDLESQNSFEDAGEPVPTEAYLEEIQEQVEAPRTEEEEKLLVRDTRSTCTYPSM